MLTGFALKEVERHLGTLSLIRKQVRRNQAEYRLMLEQVRTCGPMLEQVAKIQSEVRLAQEQVRRPFRGCQPGPTFPPSNPNMPQMKEGEALGLLGNISRETLERLVVILLVIVLGDSTESGEQD